MTLTCLHKTPQKPKYGYKIFRHYSNGYFYYGFHLSPLKRDQIAQLIKEQQLHPFQPNQWIADCATGELKTCIYLFHTPPNTMFNESYPQGMHVFFTQADANKWMADLDGETKKLLSVKKVELKEIVASGYILDQNAFLETAVCKKLKILK